MHSLGAVLRGGEMAEFIGTRLSSFLTSYAFKALRLTRRQSFEKLLALHKPGIAIFRILKNSIESCILAMAHPFILSLRGGMKVD